MAILRFRIYWEDDDSIYRDILIRHTQNFFDLHMIILKSFEFDSKHKATFYRSNDNWQRGREISLEKYDKKYKVDPLVMSETAISTEVSNPNQKFIYEYDFNKNWHFMVELITVDKDEKDKEKDKDKDKEKEKEKEKKLTYPVCIRTEGIAPSQYGTKGLVDSRLAEMEEKYDLQPEALNDGFGEKDEDGESLESEEDSSTEEANDGF
jgi:hypothetical protein